MSAREWLVIALDGLRSRIDGACAMLFCLLMGDFLTYVAKEWRHLADAPFIFVSALLVLAGLAYAAASWRFQAQIEHLNERLRLRDDRIAELKDKVGTDSPDAIKKQLDALRAQLSALRPRRLTQEQTEHLVQALGDSRGSITISHVLGASDAANLAADFVAAFRKAGWRVDEGPLLSMRTPAPSGIAVEWPHENMYQTEPRMAVTTIRDLLSKAMEAAAVQADVRERTVMWSETNAALIVTHRPESADARSADTSPREGTSQSGDRQSLPRRTELP